MGAVDARQTVGDVMRAFQFFPEKIRQFCRAKSDFLIMTALLGYGAALCWPFFGNRLIMAHDMVYAFVKAVAMSQAWMHGDWVGRWTPEILRGHGYPFFNFYAPLFFYVSALFSFFLPVIRAFNLGIILFFSLAGLTMYLFTCELWGRPGALISAIVYLAAPYHLSNLYIRGAVGELTAYALFPIVFWAIFRLVARENARVVPAGIASVAGVLLSHNISAMIFLPLAGAYALWLAAVQPPGRRIRGLLLFGFCVVMALMLTAYFWLPALWEKGFVRIDRLTRLYYDFHRHFLVLSQILFCPWRYGNSDAGGQALMPFMIGPFSLALSASTIFSFFVPGRYERKVRASIRFFLLAILITLFLPLGISRPIWEMIPVMALIQFPWRFLLLAAFALSVLAGGLDWLLRQRRGRVLYAVMIGIMLVLGFFMARPWGYADIRFTNPSHFLFDSTPWDNEEYLPRWAKGTAWQTKWGGSFLQIGVGDGKIKKYESQQWLDKRWDVLAMTPLLVSYNQYYFPGWKVEVDGQEFPILYKYEKFSGFIVFSIPPGKHAVRVYFGTTPVRLWSQRVSVLTFWALVIAVVLSYVRRRQYPSENPQ